MVKIAVEDVNDNVPEFQPSVYNVTLALAQPAQQPFLLVRAEDADSGERGEVEYFIQRGNEDGVFEVDPRSGALSLYSALDQFPLFYQLRLGARDKAGRGGGEAEVNIHVAREPSLLPGFEQQLYSFTVTEDASAFSRVGTVAPRNTKGARLFLYPDSARTHFSLDPVTGELSTRAALDHETRPEFLLNIGAVARSGHISYTQARVLVTDVNDNAPRFQPTLGLVSVPENAAAGTVVAAHTASDADTGRAGEVRYRLVRDQADTFTIDPDTGVLRTNKVTWSYYRSMITKCP